MTLAVPTTFDLVKNIIAKDCMHTWGADGDEVTFRDLTDSTGRNKIGYEKIEFCKAQAASDGLQYFWVDTCCIDKSSSAELSEAINSMFRWYQNADKCYVYLPDVSTARDTTDVRSSSRWKATFRKSRWFTPGWTLQELIAPASVEFFSREHDRLGSKRSLEETIHEITGIAIEALRGEPLSDFKRQEGWDWPKASRRLFCRSQTPSPPPPPYSLCPVGQELSPNLVEAAHILASLSEHWWRGTKRTQPSISGDEEEDKQLRRRFRRRIAD
jgi:Heterokaryon incompatibility protein (HET)